MTATGLFLAAYVAGFALYLYRCTKVAEREAVRAELRAQALAWARERRDFARWESEVSR